MDVTQITLPEVRRKIRKIIVHCSATPAGRDIGAAYIRRLHVHERGFRDIGYHYVIRLDGSVETGRELERAGAHCTGQNATSVGICYVGGLDSRYRPADTRTPAQKRTLAALIAALKLKFPHAEVFGHRDFARKSCPCFNARKEYELL